MLGRSPHELIGLNLYKEYPGIVGAEFDRIYHRARDHGESGSATIYYPDHNRWYEAHAYPSPEGISVYFRDVSERKRGEQERQRLSVEVERQVQLFERLASATPDFIYIFNLQGRFTYANRRLLEVWGLSFEQAVGKSLYELGYPQ